MAGIQTSAITVSLFLLQLLSETQSATFSIRNECSFTVWPGILSGGGKPQFPETGFILPPGQSISMSIPTSWSGRFWGRTLCSQDSTTGKFSCLTGDCGSGNIQCFGKGAIPPATLAEFTLNGSGGLDFFDVSLVDGFNVPMMVAPQGGTGGNCTIIDCSAHLNKACPKELQVFDQVNSGNIVACKSACEAFGYPQYCCSGPYSTPDQCKPSSYSMVFKNACPKAYSYAYDDASSIFTCMQADYAITFCPGSDTNTNLNPGIFTAGHPGTRVNSSGMKYAFTGSAMVVFAAIWQLWQLARPDEHHHFSS